jgi:hypothetical protein
MDMPDKVIAFDELPEELLAPFEMLNCSKLPRHWRDYIGERERLIKIKPERDPITGQIRTYATVSEKGPFVWVVDRELIPQQEAWSEIAKQTNTYNETFNSTIAGLLISYQKQLKTSYEEASTASAKKALADSYDHATTLIANNTPKSTVP